MKWLVLYWFMGFTACQAVFYGQKVHKKEHPFIYQLYSTLKDGVRCTAFAVDGGLVTAGHCLVGQESSFLRIRNHQGELISLKGTTIQVHPEYLAAIKKKAAHLFTKVRFDVGVVRSQNIKGFSLSEITENLQKKVGFCGFGQTEQDNGNVDYSSDRPLNLGRAAVGDSEGEGVLTLWGGYQNNLPSIGGEGDSGGPVFSFVNGKRQIVGLMSMASVDIDNRRGFTLVTELAPLQIWIEEQLK